MCITSSQCSRTNRTHCTMDIHELKSLLKWVSIVMNEFEVLLPDCVELECQERLHLFKNTTGQFQMQQIPTKMYQKWTLQQWPSSPHLCMQRRNSPAQTEGLSWGPRSTEATETIRCYHRRGTVAFSLIGSRENIFG